MMEPDPFISRVWRSRPERERRWIAAGAGLAAIVLAVALVWLPLERARTRLAAQLPQLRASVAALERGAEEARRLRAMPQTVSSNPAPLAAVAASGNLARDLPGAQVTVPDDKHVRLAGADVSFAGLLDWLTGVQAAHGLHVESARIEALAAPGRVRAELVLARS